MHLIQLSKRHIIMWSVQGASIQRSEIMPKIDWKREIFTIPNLLSLFRLILIPVYIVMYLNAKSPLDYYLSAGVLTLSCFTDLVDGQIARRCNMISNVGKLLDPLADKATQFAMIICLAIRYPILWALIALFVIKEGFQLIAVMVSIRKGKVLKGALMSGKICTTILFVSLVFMVMFPNIGMDVVNIIAIVDFIFLLIAFVDYVIAYLKKDSRFETVEDATKYN